jgi:hypothetical protein
VRFDDLFLDWVVANAVDDPTVVDGRFSYRDQVLEQVRPDPLDLAASAEVSPFATDYYSATPKIAGGRLRLDFDGDPYAQLLGPDGARGVESAEVAPIEPGSGMVWWSNRGDGADSRLTGRFSVPELNRDAGDAAVLTFKLWYDLETNWDFAYFLVSSDGGATWKKIATERTTDNDPNGNNFGTGLTGASDGWVEERLDLSEFAGVEVLVRFEVVTDDAVSLSGLALDDVRLAVGTCGQADCVGYDVVTDDGEVARAPSGEELPIWESTGFLRVPLTVPQRWALQAIEYRDGRILAVHRPVVDADGHAELTADVAQGASVIVAVSNLTPGTRYPAGYSLTAPAALPTRAEP